MLKNKYIEVKNIEKKFTSIEYFHILREKNKIADKLANQAAISRQAR